MLRVLNLGLTLSTSHFVVAEGFFHYQVDEAPCPVSNLHGHANLYYGVLQNEAQ